MIDSIDGILLTDLSAIYRSVTISQSKEQDTLIYSLEDGFAWVREVTGDTPWTTRSPTPIGAEIAARKAGLKPTAIYYHGI